MNVKKYIVIKTDFIGFHYWDNAPDKFGYLKSPHRHKFFVTVYKQVTGSDREIEFIDFKHQVTRYLRDFYEHKTFSLSCEHIAEDIMRFFDCDKVYVFEDDENGAMIVKDGAEEERIGPDTPKPKSPYYTRGEGQPV
jgi:light-regulated signal transduction histidine kinase (bacteriophytochrome)